MIGASNIRQQARFWRAVERADMIKTDNEARLDDREQEAAVIAAIIKTKTADEWEAYFQARHVPAARVRTMAEAIADPHFEPRRVFRHFDGVLGIDGPLGVPLAAFKFAHGGPSIEHPPHEMGQDTDSVLGKLGYSKADIARLRKSRVIQIIRPEAGLLASHGASCAYGARIPGPSKIQHPLQFVLLLWKPISGDTGIPKPPPQPNIKQSQIGRDRG